MFGELGVPELLLILGIALLIFGPRKIGDLGKGFGEAISNFKNSLRDSEPAAAAASPAEAKMAAGEPASQQPASR